MMRTLECMGGAVWTSSFLNGLPMDGFRIGRWAMELYEANQTAGKLWTDTQETSGLTHLMCTRVCVELESTCYSVFSLGSYLHLAVSVDPWDLCDPCQKSVCSSGVTASQTFRIFRIRLQTIHRYVYMQGERHNPYMERCLEFFGKKGREKRDPAGSVHVCRTGSRLYPIWEAMLRRTTDQKHRLKMSVALTEQSNCENVPTEEVTCPVIKKAKVLVEDEVTIRFAKLNSDAHTPTSGSACAAGADLYSAEDCIVPSKGKYCVSTGIQVELPYGYYGRVAPRSGLAAKHFIDVGAGVVDSDYRGELKVLLFNFNDADFQVKKGDRIAQFICERIAHTRYVEVDSLTDTDRGAGGFGSTGK